MLDSWIDSKSLVFHNNVNLRDQIMLYTNVVLCNIYIQHEYIFHPPCMLHYNISIIIFTCYRDQCTTPGTAEPFNTRYTSCKQFLVHLNHRLVIQTCEDIASFLSSHPALPHLQHGKAKGAWYIFSQTQRQNRKDGRSLCMDAQGPQQQKE